MTKTWKKSIRFCEAWCIFLTILTVLPPLASSQETYKFKRMWPTLKQPWYFYYLSYIATDDSGTIYIADLANKRIQKFTSDGAFISAWGSGGNEEGKFRWPYGIAVDAAGNIYVADSGNKRIQIFSPDDTVTIWESYGPENDETFDYPRGIAIDTAGNIYVVDRNHNCVVKFESDGTWAETWGGPERPLPGSGNGAFQWPEGIAVDAAGNIYVADTDNNRVQKRSPDGTWISWGGLEPGLEEEKFDRPKGVAVDAAGNVYVADTYNHRIKKYSADGTIILWESDPEPLGIAVVPAGYVYVLYEKYIQKLGPDGTPMTTWRCNGSEEGKFDKPHGIIVDAAGNIYVADMHNNRIQKRSPDGTWISWGGPEAGHEEGEFDRPQGIAVDAAGDVYVADTYNHRIQKCSSDGTCFSWVRYDLRFPQGVAVDAAGNVYVADTDNNRIQKRNSDGDWIGTWPEPGSSPAPEEKFDRPSGIAVYEDTEGRYVYVADTYNHRIKKYSAEGALLYTWGGPLPGKFRWPHGVAVDAEGYIYVTDGDGGDERIQKLDPDGQVILSWGSFGSMPGQMSYPYHLSVGPQGKVYVADKGNDRIQVFKKYEPLSNPKAIIVAGGGPFPGNSLWDATKASTNFAYRTLLYRGFEKKDIFYLSSDIALDFEGDGVADVRGVPTNDYLEYAITEWTLEETPADSLVLYFSDHGGNDTFILNEDQEILQSEKLAEWLHEIELSDRIVLIYDACESGSFVDELSRDDRIIITSTLPGERAKFLNQGTISFSSFFWTHILNRISIEESFNKAKQAINFTFSNQNPWLSGRAENVYIDVYAEDGAEQIVGDPPKINSVSDHHDIGDETSAELYADVTDPNDDDIARVWAVIWDSDSPGSSDDPVLSLPTLELLAPPGENHYVGTYEHFDQDETPIAIYAMDSKGNTSTPKLTSVSRNYHLTRKAIIVAGGVGDSLTRSMIETYAGLAYDALISQGYTDDDIEFRSVSTFRIEVDGLPDLVLLEQHINSLADPSIEHLDLTIYLIGGGDTGTFQINNTETLPAIATPPEESLALWLNNLQNSIPCRLTLVYDANRSGSFIPLLTPPEGAERILITSSGADEEAYFSEDGDISFSYFFWQQASIGATLYDSFAYAKNAISYFSHKNEISFSCFKKRGPLLDTNGNSVANEKSDYDVARGLTIGIGQLFADDVPPQIGSVSVDETEDGDGIVITAEDINPLEKIIAKVWAVIKPISYCGNRAVTSGEETAELEEVELTDPDGDRRYEGTYPDPIDIRAYKIIVYARDADNNVSSPQEINKIYQAEGGDIYEPDNTREEANVIVVNHTTPQPHNFHYPADEDWLKFYGLTEFIDPTTGEKLVYTYTIKASNLGDDCEPVIELYSEDLTWFRRPDTIVDNSTNSVWFETELPWEGIYYVRLLHQEAGEWDGNREYDLQVYNKDAGGLPERVYGRIEDQVSREAIHGAKITTASGGTISTHGEYHFMQIPGEWNMDARCQGYSSFHTRIGVNAGHPVRKDIRMRPHSTSASTSTSTTTTSVSLSECTTDSDCDDLLFCNGEEICVDEVCQPGSDPCQGGEECDEERDECKPPVTLPCAISIAPESAEMVSGQSRTFTINETGDCVNPNHEWSVDGTIGSSCDPNGSYVAGTNKKMFQDAIDVVKVVDQANGISAEATVAVSWRCLLLRTYGEGSEQVKVLRHFRDGVLDNTPEGKEIIRLYYEWSPEILRIMEEKKEVSEMLKTAIDGMLPLIKTSVEKLPALTRE